MVILMRIIIIIILWLINIPSVISLFSAIFWKKNHCFITSTQGVTRSESRRPDILRNICGSSVHLSAYEQKQPARMKPSSPVTPPCSTPVSPLHHASPTAAPTPKPDRTYAPIPPSQPLPDNAYSMDHRYGRLQPFTFTSHLHAGLL